MLDLECIASVGNALDIVSLDEMKKHLRISNTALDDQITAALDEAVAKLHGRDGELNRTIFPTTWVRYLPAFPSSGVIKLPYPPLISVDSITYETGDNPPPEVPSSIYTVRNNGHIGEIVLHDGAAWPTPSSLPRAVAVTFQAGYTEYPPILKRMVKILAAHYIEFPEAAINDTRATTNRKIEFAMEDLRAALRIPLSYDDWD